MDQNLTEAERANADYKSFRGGLNSAVRTAFTDLVSRALTAPMDEAQSKALVEHAGGPLRDQFVPAAVAELERTPAQTAERDTVSEILLSSLRQAHPEKYDAIVLKGLAQADFLKALGELNAKLRNDGYAVP
jgi:hypothetical protein